MPHKKKDDSRGSKSSKVTFQGFLQLKLSPEEKKHIAANPMDVSGHSQLLADLSNSGYKVSLSFSQGQDSYILTAYGNRFSHIDAGYAMSVWHRDYSRCFDILAWCSEQAGEKGSFTEWLGKDDDLDW